MGSWGSCVLPLSVLAPPWSFGETQARRESKGQEGSLLAPGGILLQPLQLSLELIFKNLSLREKSLQCFWHRSLRGGTELGWRCGETEGAGRGWIGPGPGIDL